MTIPSKPCAVPHCGAPVLDVGEERFQLCDSCFARLSDQETRFVAWRSLATGKRYGTHSLGKMRWRRDMTALLRALSVEMEFDRLEKAEREIEGGNFAAPGPNFLNVYLDGRKVPGCYVQIPKKDGEA
jgi:hypothetical protein